MDIERRSLFGLLPAAGLVATGAALAGASQAVAQEANESTWDRIMRTRTLRVGAAAYEPWYFKDEARGSAPGGVLVGDMMWRGIGIGVGKAIADALEVEMAVVETTWANAVAGLQSNQFDIMFVLDATPVRARAIDFLGVPIGYYPLALLTRDNETRTSWAEFNTPETRIAVQLGSVMDQFLTRTTTDAQLIRLQDASQTYAAFQSNRADAICAVGPSLSLAQARMGIGKVINPSPFVPLPAGTGFRWEPNNRFKDYLTAAATYLYATGRVQEIYEEFLDYRGLDPNNFASLIREQW